MAKLRTQGPVSSPADRKARLDNCRMCLGCGRDLQNLIRRVGYAESACPHGQWSAVEAHRPEPVELPSGVRETLAAQTHERMKAAVADRKAKVEVRKAGTPTSVASKTLAQKAGDFLRAITGPQCSTEEFVRRMAACRRNACGQLKIADSKLYCGACGCPQWRLAELHTKLWFERLECPADPPRW